MLKTFRMMLIVAMLSSAATYVFAEDPGAPVYDADSMTQGADQSGDADMQTSPPPAAPERKRSHAEVQELQPSVTSTSIQNDQSFVPPQSMTLDQRVRKVEQQMNNLQSSNSNSKVENLQNEIQALRGQVDDLTHQLQTLQKKQTEQQQSLEKRLSKMASQPASSDEKPLQPKSELKTADKSKPKAANTDDDELTPAASLAKSEDDVPVASAAEKSTPKKAAAADSTQPDVAEEQKTYQTAYDLIKAKKYNEAITTLQDMLKKYPTGQSAANAHYWLGELYGLTGKNDQSATEFSTIIRDFPNSSKVADAQLKLGLIYATEMKWSQAKAAFKKVTSSYPGTASARLAQEQLKQIKQAGH